MLILNTLARSFHSKFPVSLMFIYFLSMKRSVICCIVCLIVVLSFARQAFSQDATATENSYPLSDFFQYNPDLENRVGEIFQSLSDTQVVGQLIVPAVGRLGKETSYVANLVKEGKVGGVILLNGTKSGFTQIVNNFDSIAAANANLPMIYSADAEPSLIGYKIKGSTKVKKANQVTSRKEVKQVAETIAGDLNDIGITHNFAPVVDVSPNNAAIGNRSFGNDKDTIINWSNVFISSMQENGVLATAKHFPGHGLVKGDTHEKLVFIDGEMQEVDNYKPLIADGVMSIMVAHIAVKNNEKYNTNGLPATCSREIVTDLLKDEMNFKGIIITDAMNMGGVRRIPQSGLKAIQAGCDMLLMPVNENKDINEILAEMSENEAFKSQVHASVKKIIRFKLCLGLME
jgi:beta-N-acetylhexosaminidase